MMIWVLAVLISVKITDDGIDDKVVSYCPAHSHGDAALGFVSTFS
jgi:hypothetical protein